MFVIVRTTSKLYKPFKFMLYDAIKNGSPID